MLNVLNTRLRGNATKLGFRNSVIESLAEHLAASNLIMFSSWS